jgi:membrane associated rhomboid family serine protease
MSLLQQNSRKRILLGEDGNALVLLIIFNIIVYVLLNFTKIVYLLNNSTVEVFESQVLSYVAVPPEPQVFASRPWTMLIYMFSHYKLLELVGSMLWLWGFGYIFQSLAGNRRLIPVYIYGGLAGSVFFLLAVNLIPALKANINTNSPLLGAGPALMALAVAITALAPTYKVFPRFNIPLWLLTGTFVVIRFITINDENLGEIAALIAGGLMGYIFIWQLQKGNDWSQWMVDVVHWADDLFSPEKKHIKNPPKKRLFYKSNQKPYEITPHVTQQRIDDLLDKIHHRGYHSLTEEEKEFLTKASREEL